MCILCPTSNQQTPLKVAHEPKSHNIECGCFLFFFFHNLNLLLPGGELTFFVKSNDFFLVNLEFCWFSHLLTNNGILPLTNRALTKGVNDHFIAFKS